MALVTLNFAKSNAMQISSRFTIALHILTALETFKGRFRLTSEFLASSVQVNPVIIRNILLQLKAAEMVQIPRGRGSIVEVDDIAV